MLLSARPFVFCLLLCGCSMSAASAATIQVTAADSGFYSETGQHVQTNENYLTGRFNTVDRSFFVFDLTGVSGQVTAATLNLFNPDISAFLKGYVSPDPSETLAIFDVTTPVATLTAGGNGLVGIFNDLGTGTQFGSIVVSPADNGQTVSIVFNAAGLAAINAALGSTIAFGGALTTLGAGPADEYVFGFSTATFAGGDVRRLDLTVVPEPGLAALLAVGLAGALRRRHS
ncbi:MAG: PEP-CTERM sorting domain-containing protein [Vicinamibacteraceae bacterium]|nr:PEP-CTERM sorting domain-containing protein [Vicinamibacteraceae bacterium]